MTNEEKQAIIDKALDLGFAPDSKHTFDCKYDCGRFILGVYDDFAVLEVEAEESPVTLKCFESYKVLETLFNAITK